MITQTNQTQIIFFVKKRTLEQYFATVYNL